MLRRFLPCVSTMISICTILRLGNVAESQDIQFERVQLSDKFYSEGGTHGDYNGDKQGDVVVGPWIYWGPAFESKSRFYEGDAVDPIGYTENFLMYSDDVDADGQLDILVLGFPGKESWWYRNPGSHAANQLWDRYTMLESVDNESPLIADINGDGVKDLVCSSHGQYGYATHAGQAPTDLWKFVTISPNNGYQRFTHGLGIGDVDNDGKLDLLEKDGWWKNPGQQAATDKLWQFNPFAFSSGGSQMYALDLDGDGKNEVLTGLVAHGFGLVYYKSLNAEATSFERVDIMTSDSSTSPVGVVVSQLHAVDLGDINQDGVPDIVTGKRWWAHANKDDGNSQPATLLWLETQRVAGRVHFVPHVIDISSGVGTQVTVGDVNGDGLLDVVAGIKRGAYLFLQRPANMASGKSLVPGLADKDEFGQRPATEFVAVKDTRGGFLPALDGRPLNLGFESGDLTDWEIRGPISAGVIAKSPEQKTVDSKSSLGSFLVNTDIKGARMVGELISRPFRLSRSKATFQMGGSPKPELRVEVVSAASGHVLASSSPDGSESLKLQTWELNEHLGELVRIRVVDHAEDGSIQFGEFRLFND